jgi:thiol-disulfide isomerase/thioredoxin
MALLKDKDREFLTKEFGKLTEPVKLVYFTQEHECPYCETTGQIVSEVAGLSDKITTAVYDFVADKALAGKYRVDKIPAIVVERGGDQPRDFGMRFYGIPSGYEFTSLTALTTETKAALATITQPVHIQVFSTPT